MAFLLDEEDAYAAELIDEFDAPDALLQHEATTRQPLAQKQQQPPPPFVSAQSLRHQPVFLEHAPVAHTQSTGALYPSFQELSGRNSVRNDSLSSASSSSTSGVPATQSPPPSPLQHPGHRYPRLEPSAIQRETIEMSVSSHHQDFAMRDLYGRNSASGGDTAKPSLPATDAPAHIADPPVRPVPVRLPTSEPQSPVQVETETLPLLSEQEFEAKQRQIARELKGYEQQLDYLAHALAGNTPHQVEERKRREHERQEREHMRLVAMENRVQHQIERAYEREQRRVKVLERAHRASRSPSPENRKVESRDDEEMPHGEL